MTKHRIVVADDHAIVRTGLVSLLETEPDIDVVGEACNGETAISMALRLKPDVVIMDLMMPDVDGIAATERILAAEPTIKVLMLTTSTVSDDLARALDTGVSGVITKNAEYAKLVEAIRDVAAGKIAVSSEVRRLIDEDPPAPKLTARQSDVLHSLTRGLSNQEIAKQFGIGRESVKEHIDSLYAKIGAANRTEAVAIAFRKHLLKF
ncbi:MAG: response regulator transcription factor [Kiritimatiellae bacterium]|nr:response regulator transcription factor [Kiritimatiellia bacterium]